MYCIWYILIWVICLLYKCSCHSGPSSPHAVDKWRKMKPQATFSIWHDIKYVPTITIYLYMHIYVNIYINEPKTYQTYKTRNSMMVDQLNLEFSSYYVNYIVSDLDHPTPWTLCI